MRIRLEALGCRLNTSEMEQLARQLRAAGHEVTDADGPCDVCVLNTCAVTHLAERKSRQMIRRLQQMHPHALLVVTGCYAELAPTHLQAMGVPLIVGNRQKEHLMEIIGQKLGLPMVSPTSPLVSARGLRTRAFVKVQDGCDNACTFCVVRLARGEGRSRPPEEVVQEVHQLVRAGYREVVLSGVHLGAYGHDWGDRLGLFHLVRRLLDETEPARLRLSSLEPWDILPEFFTLWEDHRLARHLHLPLQSGCDATLRRMARRTTTQSFAQLVAAARAVIPDLAVTTDIMVGFPGESEAEFAESIAFVEAMQFARLHVFRYSPRPGTRAATMPNQVPPAVARERAQQMHALGIKLERAFRRQFIGRTMEVLWETAQTTNQSSQLWTGLTGNYLRVTAWSTEDLYNTITPTRLIAETEDGLYGEVECSRSAAVPLPIACPQLREGR
ncbi:MAG: tRNA (N(6)-L-threonylcarbamoyladenosine(37)-C(2))-methylthiotransferase MtaB [Anaerolineae bacterium]|nr:tRNA (N(6)-L-threonylcarbamoyladenosine(37)-C(2))-methylthiotransferase MtaB [Anaerolineae bacterium]MDW8070327.1 tRNA (N(6)-L-threonylcarbamoyladenosine(37)-C(2))-methylthiotransferase MtaB [Anaerolineae bacterium]